MNAILKLIPWSSILSYVITIFMGATPAMWAKAKELVAQAEANFPSAGSGEDKKAWVLAELKRDYSQAKSHLIATVFGLAVQDLQKRLGKA